MGKRIDYLDGLKGLCAVLVTLYHFMILANFEGYVGYGTSYTTEEALNRILNNPLSAFITNNAIALYIFFTMIAIFPIVSFRKKNSNPEIMGRYACKRYFQLLPICFITSIVMVLLYNYGLLRFDNITDLTMFPWAKSCNPDDTNFLLAIRHMLFDAWFVSGCEVASLWCLNIVYKGSLAVYATYALFGNSKNRYLPTIALFVISVVDVNYIFFAFGSIIGEMLSSQEIKPLPLPLGILLIVVSIFVVKIPNNLYPFTLSTSVNGGLGAFIFLYSVVRCTKLQNIFDNKVMRYLGLTSFEIIIGHCFVMATLSYPILQLLMTKMELGFLLALVLGIISLLLTIPISHLLAKFISPLGNKLAKKVETICFKTN